MAEFHSATLSVITVDGEPGEGPDLHRHPYEEVFVIVDGEVRFTIGDETVTAKAGDVLIAPPNTPHGFKITIPGRSVNIHSSPEFRTEWL
jgi:quercetin dioxygenase-like cupin family protein